MRDYIPFEYPKTEDGEYTAILNEGEVLMSRRMQLGLTQHEVAEMAGLHFSQYQRLEGGERFLSGCSMRIGLAVCSVLLLDPADIIQPACRRADAGKMRAPSFWCVPDSHRAGRKKIRRDIMEVLVSRDAIMVPDSVLRALGRPPRIHCVVDVQKHRILLSESPDGVAVSPDSLLAIPVRGLFDGSAIYSVKCRLVKDRNDEHLILADLTTAGAVHE